ncbi:ABC transporter permease [Roseateles depolymerans]|uniref:ABC transporter permease protein n=1 Tax=Roseateles depolymerans TaxID=76731 RepID=A0A0U3LM82_9BURK|nr:ABC transporter permease [Roseateles depolymerans]ALV09231.1 ABC transporter permease protein [Roseateles depolymerans]REG13989.1 peptide/nickel transport system permease protein [Roseateles depolymerans]
MSSVMTAGGAASPKAQKSQGVWVASWRRMRADKVGMTALAIVALSLLLVLAAGLGLVAGDWQKETGVPNAPPTFMGPAATDTTATVAAAKGPNVDLSDIDPLAPKYGEWTERAKQYKTDESPRAQTLPFGADRLGRDVLSKAIKGAEISIMVGVLAAVVATLIGTVLGALSGFYGGKVGDFLEWVYNVFTAMPNILLIFAFAVVFGRGVLPVVMILGLAGWTGIYRLVRAEFMKHSVREYVRSAEAIGASRTSRMFKHILPNVSHVALVQLSLHVVSFIKSEVILSYLGLGVSVDQVSWGTMLSEAQNELILGYWWQLAVVTVFMAVFVTAFSLFTDALRDALDPKLR